MSVAVDFWSVVGFAGFGVFDLLQVITDAGCGVFVITDAQTAYFKALFYWLHTDCRRKFATEKTATVNKKNIADA